MAGQAFCERPMRRGGRTDVPPRVRTRGDSVPGDAPNAGDNGAALLADRAAAADRDRLGPGPAVYLPTRTAATVQICSIRGRPQTAAAWFIRSTDRRAGDQDFETDKLARQLAHKTGETITEALKQALRERLTRFAGRNRRTGVSGRLLAIGRPCAAHMQEPGDSLLAVAACGRAIILAVCEVGKELGALVQEVIYEKGAEAGVIPIWPARLSCSLWP